MACTHAVLQFNKLLVLDVIRSDDNGIRQGEKHLF